jgi:hypothetical protein
MTNFRAVFSGGDLRSIGNSNSVIDLIHDQKDFDELFSYIDFPDRIIAMRAIDCIEKITIYKPQYLSIHKDDILRLSDIAITKEQKWHFALLIARLELKGKEFDKAWSKLMNWANDKKNSRIVRVNSIQALYEMSMQDHDLKKELNATFEQLKLENVPSLNARIHKLKIHL